VADVVVAAADDALTLAGDETPWAVSMVMASTTFGTIRSRRGESGALKKKTLGDRRVRPRPARLLRRTPLLQRARLRQRSGRL
jgi:hypothetical protein